MVPVTVTSVLVGFYIGPVVLSSAVRERCARYAQAAPLNRLDPRSVTESEDCGAFYEPMTLVVIRLHRLPIME